MEPYFWVCTILFLGGFTQGLSGFGGVLLSVPLLALVLDIKMVIPIAAVAGLVMTLLLFIQLRGYFQWKKLFPLVAGALPGVPFGVLFLKHVDKSVIQWILGTTLTAYALYGLVVRSRGRGLDVKWGFPFGFLAGGLGGAVGASGPPVIVYTSLQSWSKDEIKITLQGFYVISGAVVVLAHALNGLTTWPVLRFSGVALPWLLLGTYAGSRFYGFLGEDTYRRVVLVLLGLLGLFMIFRS
jgi:uncharacterized membrane protein YfcA